MEGMKPSGLGQQQGLAKGHRVASALPGHGRGPAGRGRTRVAVRCGKVPERETAFKDFVAKPEKSDMHLGNALSLAKACALAYKKKPIVEATAKNWGLREVTCIGYGIREGPDTQCYVAAGDDFIIVVFRGTMTEQWTDVKLDCEIAMERGPKDWKWNCNVHGGFLEGVEGVCERSKIIQSVLDKVYDLQDKYGKRNPLAIYVTGHSLGAAESTLATAYMLQDDNLKDHVVGNYTFGSPRVGDGKFKRFFEKATKAGTKLTHRFQNRKDVVTYVPVWRPWWRYAHVGQWWYMQGDNQKLVNNPHWTTRLWDDMFWSAEDSKNWLNRAGPIYDHMLAHDDGPGGYIDGLEKNLEAA